MDPTFELQNPATLSRDDLFKSLKTAQRLFSESLEFIRDAGLPPPEISADDRREALHIYHESPLAPAAPSTLGAKRMLESLLAKHDYQMQAPFQKMRNYVIYKFFELAENDDPNISLKALNSLGKVSDIGLFTDKLEISVTQKSTLELEDELSTLLKGFVKRKSGKTTIEDASYRELTDAELRGEVDV